MGEQVLRTLSDHTRAMRPLVEAVLDNDDLLRSYRASTVEALADLSALGTLSPIDAVELGRMRERADTLAWLAGRKRAALTVAQTNPPEAERAKIIAQQVGVEMDSIFQGLHQGDALKAQDLARDAAVAETDAAEAGHGA